MSQEDQTQTTRFAENKTAKVSWFHHLENEVQVA
jgi:hypothetical protein